MHVVMINDGRETSTMSSPFSQNLQSIFLVGYLLLSIGGYLPSAYSYALFNSYGIDHSTIEHFFVYCFIASLFAGTFIASLADHFGRRSACLLCSLVYGLYHVACNCSDERILIIGHIFRGVGDALYSTAFEAWLMQEHEQRDLHSRTLEQILHKTNVCLNIATIGTGFAAQFLSELYGYIAPFNVGVGFFILTFIFIFCRWSENYGRKKILAHSSFTSAMKILRTNPRIVLCGLSNALFRASFYIWLIEWTPTLQAAENKIFTDPIPLGIIYSSYLLARLLGSFAFGPLIKRFRVQTIIIVIFLLSAVGLSASVITPNEQLIILMGFLLFQVCDGIFVPSIALLRSTYIPNEFRTTLMNYLRVPQLLLMLVVLLGHFPLSIVFTFCVLMLLVAVCIMMVLRKH